jgi:hypothetical protein
MRPDAYVPGSPALFYRGGDFEKEQNLTSIAFLLFRNVFMVRYVIRKGIKPDDWMVWDREIRKPAQLNGRALVRLKREQADLSFHILTGLPVKIAENVKEWEVIYGSDIVLPCRDETDAKLLARELVKKGHRVSARTVDGLLPSRSIDFEHIQAWVGQLGRVAH